MSLRRVAGMIGEAVPRPLKAASQLSPAIKRSSVTPYSADHCKDPPVHPPLNLRTLPLEADLWCAKTIRLFARPSNVRFSPDYVRFSPKSRHWRGYRWMSAFDPKRTLAVWTHPWTNTNLSSLW